MLEHIYVAIIHVANTDKQRLFIASNSKVNMLAVHKYTYIIRLCFLIYLTISVT